MKKFLSTVLMLTCLIGLTACGSVEGQNSVQEQKVENAKIKASYVVELTKDMVGQGVTDEILASYSNVELADIFTSMYYQATQDGQFSAINKSVSGALTSFEEGMEALGEGIEFGEPEASVDDDVIIVQIPVTGTNGTGSVEIIFSNDIYFEMSSCTMNLEESFGELMKRAALNTLLGISMVFAVLVIIIVIISSFSLIPKLQEKFANKGAKEDKKEAPVAPVVDTTAELVSDEELVAVIAAAIAAYEGTSTDGFRVRSIKRASTNNWKKQ